MWNPEWEGQHQPAQEQAAEPEQAVNEQLWDPGDGHADDEQVRQLEWAAFLGEQGHLESALEPAARRPQAGRADGPNRVAVPTEDGQQQPEGEAAAKVETVARGGQHQTEERQSQHSGSCRESRPS